MPLIEIIADDRHFFVSLTTLNNDPTFIITQLVNETLSEILCDCVEVINKHVYRIDIDPKILEDIIRELRGASKDTYMNHIKNTLFIQQITPLEKETKQVNEKVNDQTQIQGQINEQTQSPSKSSNVETQSVEKPNDIAVIQIVTADVTNTNKRTNIFRKQDELHTNKNYVDFSVSERDNIRLSDLLGGMNKHANTNMSVTSSIEKSNTNRSDISDSEYSKFNSSSMKESAYDVSDSFMDFHAPKRSKQEIKELSNLNLNQGVKAPKGHHIYKSRKIEVNTLNEN